MLNEQNKLYEFLNENNSLNEIQDYIRKIITIRGFSEQRVQDKIAGSYRRHRCNKERQKL